MSLDSSRRFVLQGESSFETAGEVVAFDRELSVIAVRGSGGKTRFWPLVENGRLKPVVDRVFTLAEASAAHAYMESGTHIGKIILEVAA